MRHRSVLVVVVMFGLVAGLTGLVAGRAPRLAATSLAAPLSNAQTGGDAARYLPAPEVLGEGWIVAGAGRPDVDSAVFRDASGAIYLGPEGARVTVLVYLNHPGPEVRQRAWEDTGVYFYQLRSEFGLFDPARDAELRGQPLPAGCIDAQRTDGLDDFSHLPVGLTLCAADPDASILVAVWGSLGGRTGYEASDAVAILAHQAAQETAEARPTPAPRPTETVPAVAIEMHDIRFEPDEVTIPSNIPVTIALNNAGAAQHSFTIDALGIHSGEYTSGEVGTVTVAAPPGDYEFFCSVPGHKEAGMVGTLHVR